MRRRDDRGGLHGSLEVDVKPDQDADEKFEWDMITVMLLVLLIIFVLITVIAIGPLGHTT